MIKQYKSKKELIITDPTKFPDDFWNYWVNPIVGYYIPAKRSTPKQRKSRAKCNTED